MVTSPAVLAVIPARGGSKSIPGKNIRPFGGHPLIAYSIAAGLRAARVTRVVVSTDDAAIAEVGRHYGADVPFMRPSSLAQDETPDLPVFKHVLAELEAREGFRPAIIVQLRPTSPLRPPGLVDEAIDLLGRQASADSVRGVTPSSQNPFKMWRIGASGSLVPLLDEVENAYDMPRQSLPATYWQTGHVDVVRRGTILTQHSMTGRVIWPFQIDGRYAADIDAPSDWECAEHLLTRGDLD
ncbi:partial N-acylneuraminate cytidylyltransferase, partial [Planctomycetaceae bacterium]